MNKTCQKCGKLYDAPPTKNKKFCSTECAGNHSEKIAKTCEECGKTYEVPPSKAGRSRFCSRHCHGVYSGHQQTMAATETRICPACGKEYQTTNHHGGKKTCSPECANKRKQLSGGQPRTINKTKVECAHCGKERYVFPSRIDGRNFFCNHKCKAAYQFAQGSVEIQCQVCGKPFTSSRSLAYAENPNRRAKYCSRGCMAEAISIRRRGENNPNWVGGREQVTWRGDDWGKQRRKAKRRDEYTCQRCVKKFPPYSPILHVHHIVPFRLFSDDFESANKLDNLICLCLSCHTTVESATRNFLIDRDTEDTEKLRDEIIALLYDASPLLLGTIPADAGWPMQPG